MKQRRILLIAISSVIGIVCLASCGAISYSLIGGYLRLAAAKNRLETTLEHLPPVPGGVVVKRWDGNSGGQEEDCLALLVEELVGTNDLSYAEVLDFYGTSLRKAGWHLNGADARWRGFDKDEVDIGVSSFYDVSMIGKGAVDEAKSKFRTIFLLDVGTPIILPVPQNCRPRR